MKVVQVAAAVILDQQQQVFLAKRPQEVHQGGKWEFPGGKLEVGESAYQALKRELQEEIGIDINTAQEFLEISHQYSDKSVVLTVFIVSDYQGQPWGREGQQTIWRKADELAALDFPAANAEIVEKLQSWLLKDSN